MTTATVPNNATSTAPSRTFSLARAELTQFFRNPTLLAMGLIFPALFALGMYALNNFASEGAIDSRSNAANSLEMFALIALMFIQYYSVLSTTAARRDENVLKRLRTGEATDFNIIVALCFPGAALSVVSFVLFLPALGVISSTAPANIGWILIAVVGGLVISSALALLTAAYTKNAESAQVTSLPVIALAMASQAQVREAMPDNVSTVIAATPFAAVSDLAIAGWQGSDDNPWQATLVLIGWCVVSIVVAARTMRWETHRG